MNQSSSTKINFPIAYIPAIDGIRGALLCFVFVGHVNYSLVPSAMMVMDMFFVISGYLITSVIQKTTLTTGRMPFKTFYLRRIARLAPACYFLLLVFSLYAIFFMDDIGKQLYEVLVSGLYVSNWVKANNFYTPYYLGHTWSLSVEEQFYLIWPMFIALTLRFRLSLVANIIVMLTLAVMFMCWRIYLVDSGANFTRLFHGTDMRADAFLIGGAIGTALPLLVKIGADGWKGWFFVGCIASVILSYVALTQSTLKTNYYVFWQPLVLFASALLILSIVLHKDGIIAKSLSIKLFTVPGKASYGIYLWHFPILTLLKEKTDLSLLEVGLYGLVLTAVISYFSYVYIESPFMKKRAGYNSK